MKKNLLLLLIFSNSVNAFEVKHLTLNQPAPFEGYLIEPKMEQHFRFLDEELNYQKQLNVSLTNINKLYEENTTIMQSRINNQQQQLNSSQEGFFSKTGFFFLGAATAILIAFATNKATR